MKKLFIFTLALLATLIAGAQTSTGIQGNGVTGGGGSPKGSNYSTQYKNGTQFGGTGPGTSGYILTSTGASSAPTFQAPPSVGAAGSDTYVQYNNNGAFGANSQLVVNKATGRLFANGLDSANDINANDAINVNATLFLANAATPSALASGSTNNYNPGGVLGSRTTFRLTPDGTSGSTVTGFSATANGYIVHLYNIQTTTAGTLTLAHLNSGSTASNQIYCPGAVDLVIQAGGGAILRYDGTSSFWRVVAISNAASVSFPLIAPNGSSGAPSYSFTGSSGSGLYYDVGSGYIVLRSATDINLSSNGGNILIGGTGHIFKMASTKVTNDGISCTATVTNAFSGSNVRNGTGSCSLLFSAGAFSTAPACTASQVIGVPTAIVSVNNVTSSGLDVLTANSTTGVALDTTFSVTCIGS